jgi:hypothetical protein
VPFLHVRGRVIDASETNLREKEPAGRKRTPARGIEVYGSKDIQSIKEVSVFQLAKGVANERGFIMSCTGGDL